MAEILEKVSTRLEELEYYRGRMLQTPRKDGIWKDNRILSCEICGRNNHSTTTCYFQQHQTVRRRHRDNGRNDTHPGCSWRNNTRTYPMTSGGRRGAITDLLTTSRHPFRSFDTLRDSAVRRQVQS